MKVIRKRRSAFAGDIPVGSFSDIAFLLIIFFILVTTLNKPRGVEIDLPAGEVAETTEEGENVISMKDDKFFWKKSETPIAIDELRQTLVDMRLAELAEDEQVIMIEAAGSVPWENYYRALAIVSQAGGRVVIVEEEE